MSIRATGRVVNGHLRVDMPVDLPDNTEVELIEGPGAEQEEIDPQLEAALCESVEQFARGEASSWEDVRSRLHAGEARGRR
jgi:hypothetical protein